jgi:hypothetical protein
LYDVWIVEEQFGIMMGSWGDYSLLGILGRSGTEDLEKTRKGPQRGDSSAEYLCYDMIDTMIDTTLYSHDISFSIDKLQLPWSESLISILLPCRIRTSRFIPNNPWRRFPTPMNQHGSNSWVSNSIDPHDPHSISFKYQALECMHYVVGYSHCSSSLHIAAWPATSQDVELGWISRTLVKRRNKFHSFNSRWLMSVGTNSPPLMAIPISICFEIVKQLGLCSESTLAQSAIRKC